MDNNNKWDELSLTEKSEIMKQAVANGITNLQDIRNSYNDTVNNYIDNIYANGTGESYGDPSDHYNNIDEEMISHMTPDARGHYDDSVKLPNHPSSPTRGAFNGQYFDFTDKGFEDPNYTMFGLQDNGDGNTIMRYNGDVVMPELTVTPNGNYYDDTYNNIKIHQGHKHELGGPVKHDARYNHAVTIYQSFINQGISPQAALELTNQKVAEKGWSGWASGDNKKYNNVDSFTDHVVNHFNKMYPDSLKANNFNQFYKGIEVTPKYKYNPNPALYKGKLLETRPGVKKRINEYRRLQGQSPLSLVSPTSTPLPWEEGILYNPQLPLEISTKQPVIAADGGRLYDGGGKEDIYDKSAKVGNKTYPARTMLINGKETPVFLADDNRMYAVGDDKTPFEIWSQYSLPEVTVTPSKNKDKITGDYYNNSANRYYDSSYDPNGFMDFMNAATLGIGNRLSVSQDARLVKDIYDATTGNKSWEDVVNSAILGNNGIFDNPYANMALDIVVPTVGGKYRSIANATTKGVQEVSYAMGRCAPSNVKDFIRGKIISKELDKLNPRPNISTPTPIIRTKAGDVEVDDPNLFYHLDRGDNVGAFSSNGAYVDNGMLYPGKSKDVSQTSYSWWNKGKPYAYNVGEEPLTRMVTSSENPSLIKVRDQNYPIGQWNGKRGFVLNSEYVSSSPIDVSNSTYVFDPSYGWRKSDLSSSTIDWNNAVFAHNFAHADGGPLESDEDNLLAPIIKYYEDSNPYLSIKDQNTFDRGGQMKRARQAVGYFVNKGLTREQAAGLVGNLMRESRMNTNAINPASGAYGLGQWLGSRKTKLFKKYGRNPSFYQQLDYIWDELNTSHRKGLQMLKSSKTVDEAARNAFGYYEFSAGPQAAIAAMNKNGKNTKWKNPNGTVAMNNGITNAWVAYGKANPNIKLQGLNVDKPVLGYNKTIPNYDFTSAVDGLNVQDSIANFSGETPKFQYDLFPSNPTDYGTPINWSTPEKKIETPTIIPKEDNNGLGLLALINQIYDSPKQEPLATYTPKRNNSMFVVSAPTSNDTFLDSSWFKKGGYLYSDGGTTDDESSIIQRYNF